MKQCNIRMYEDILNEMEMVYRHDDRPWMIGFSGGKDSTLLCCLVFEMILRIPKKERRKKIYIVSSDTLVENPIVRNYMHKMSDMIGIAGKELKIFSDIIYPNVADTFWTKVIGLGYLTPEPPGFRWCTERLKIKPMNKYVTNIIEKNGEIVLLLGVRKAESTYRARNIKAREIEGKLLVPHNAIEKAYVYNPLSEIPNEEVWNFLLRNDGKTPWGSDNKYLFSLYQGESFSEEASVIGEIDESKIPVTGNSRFGCWICTMVKEDKSLKTFIDKGEKWLIPLREYRNWLLELRSNPEKRELKRRNGSMYRRANGELGRGPFNFDTRKDMLRKLLQLEVDTGLELITVEELKQIDSLWDLEGDLTRRCLVDIYYGVKGIRLSWDEYKIARYDKETINEIVKECSNFDIPFELISKLIIQIENNKHYSHSTALTKAFNKVINQGWLHFDAMEKGLKDDNKKISNE